MSIRSVDHFRSLRGVVIQCLPYVRKNWSRLQSWSERNCAPTTDYLQKPPGKRRCKWCHQRLESKRGQWHPLCANLYYACRGKAINFYRRPVIPGGKCASCGAPGIPSRKKWLRAEECDKEWDRYRSIRDSHHDRLDTLHKLGFIDFYRMPYGMLIRWVTSQIKEPDCDRYLSRKRNAGWKRSDICRHELDHRMPIAVARHKDPEYFVRAFLPSNLNWLCRDCHRQKTAKDVKIISALKRIKKSGQLGLYSDALPTLREGISIQKRYEILQQELLGNGGFRAEKDSNQKPEKGANLRRMRRTHSGDEGREFPSLFE